MERKRPEESEGKQPIQIHHRKVKQALGTSMNNFCYRLSKEMIVKSFAIVIKKILPVYAHEREVPLPLVLNVYISVTSPPPPLLPCLKTSPPPLPENVLNG